MSKSTQSVRPQVSVQEEIARTDLSNWKAVVSRANNPVTARLIVEALEADPATKAANLGVFLVARETVKRDQIRYSRGKRAGQVVGTVGRLLFRACKSIVSFIALGVAHARGKATAPVVAVAPVRVTEESEPLVWPTIMFSLPELELKGATVH